MIYFVGIHHKPRKEAFCSTTLSGKKIDAVINRINDRCMKVNLFTTEYIPVLQSDEYSIEIQGFFKRVPQDDCTIVLLGKAVLDHFPHGYYRHCNVLIFRHPSFSPPSFVDDLVNFINSKH
jgi:hypothetical protein